MGGAKRNGETDDAREPRERLDSSNRQIREPLLRERARSESSSYRMTPAREEHVAVPTVMPPAAPRAHDASTPLIAPFEPTTQQRAPREPRLRHSTRSHVSLSLAAAEASAQRVIDRAAEAHKSDEESRKTSETPQAPRESGRVLRTRAQTVAGLGSLRPRADENADDNADD